MALTPPFPMFQVENFYLFLTASLLINLAPGPDMIYTAARSMSQGIRAGIFSALGVFTGCLFHISAAVLGLSAIIEKSVLIFSIIKYAGAAYLVYLGVRSFISRNRKVTSPNKLTPMPDRNIFLQGMITNILNPKVAIFFLSFLPQFIHPNSPYLKEQIAFLGFWFNMQGMLVLMLVAIITGTFKNVLQPNSAFRNWQEKITGIILIGLGLKVFFSKK